MKKIVSVLVEAIASSTGEVFGRLLFVFDCSGSEVVEVVE